MPNRQISLPLWSVAVIVFASFGGIYAVKAYNDQSLRSFAKGQAVAQAENARRDAARARVIDLNTALKECKGRAVARREGNKRAAIQRRLQLAIASFARRAAERVQEALDANGGKPTTDQSAVMAYRRIALDVLTEVKGGKRRPVVPKPLPLIYCNTERARLQDAEVAARELNVRLTGITDTP
jgi:hypothetical protein